MTGRILDFSHNNNNTVDSEQPSSGIKVYNKNDRSQSRISQQYVDSNETTHLNAGLNTYEKVEVI